MNTKFAPWIISASVIALATAAGGAALAQGYDYSQPPIVVSQPVPPDRGTNDDTSGGRTFADQPFDVNGTEVVCTGTDSDSRHDPRWGAYSLRMEFAGVGGQFLGEERVTVSGNGLNVSVHCKGPWVLMKVPAGHYNIHVEVPEGGSKNGSAVVGHGQTRVVMSFPTGGQTTGQQRNQQ